jgi:vacuolar-type H+-ATPase subunit I/STV1
VRHVAQFTQGSEQMSLVQLFVPTEVAHDAVAELGELGNVQFKDVSRFLQMFHSLTHFYLVS